MWQKRSGSGLLSERNQTNECLYCLKDKNSVADLWHTFSCKSLLCAECSDQLRVLNQNVRIEEMECFVLYEYNPFFADLLLQYKELNDEALYPVFLEKQKNYLNKKYKDYCVVCVPSSNSKIEKRGFDAVGKIFSVLNLEQKSLFIKDEIKDQKNSNLFERRQIFNYIHMKNEEKLRNLKVLLVDDVMTSGSSLLACYRLLKKAGCEIVVISLSYCRNNGT